MMNLWWHHSQDQCVLLSDGGSAVLLCSEAYKENFHCTCNNEPFKIDSIGIAGGQYRDMNDDNVTKRVAEKCFAKVPISK